VKLGGGVRTVIYTLGGQPCFFDPDGRGKDFVPTGRSLPHLKSEQNFIVYTLWKAPQMLPIIYTHAAVFKRLANGAGMWFLTISECFLILPL